MLRALFLTVILGTLVFGAGQTRAEMTQGQTQDGVDVQAAMPPMELITAMFLDLEASAAQGAPVEKNSAVFSTADRIAIYTKFRYVGRTNPGAVDGFMNLETHILIKDDTGRVVVDQQVAGPELEAVRYPYSGPLPVAYFDSFKLNLFTLPRAGNYTATLTFTDHTRPVDQTQPVIVALPFDVR